MVIRPHVLKDLVEVKGSYNSIHGKIISEWKRNGKKLRMHVVVPVNTTATVYVPATSASAITESGKPVTQMKGGKFQSMQGSSALITVGSGDYTFETSMP